MPQKKFLDRKETTPKRKGGVLVKEKGKQGLHNGILTEGKKRPEKKKTKVLRGGSSAGDMALAVKLETGERGS